MARTVIDFKGVSKNYNIYRTNLQRITGILFGKKPAEVKHAIRNVSVKIEEGERVAVMGVTDSGCSKFVKMAAGIIYPTKGKIKTTGSINAMIGAGAGFDDELSCAENIYLKGIVTGANKTTLKRNEKAILSFAGAEGYEDLALKRAPKGTLVRMALAIHLLNKDDILIIDDSFSSGGNDSRAKCEDAVKQYLEKNSKITAVFATSRTSFAKETCTRGIVLDKGEIVYDGQIRAACRVFRRDYLKKVKEED